METRRAFLKRTAALPLVFGIPLGGCREARSPAWFSEALARMAAENKAGLVVRLPAERAARHEFGHGFVGLLNSSNPDLRELFAETLVLCLEPAAVAANVRGARSEDDLILIDADGYAVAGAPFPPGRLAPPESPPGKFRSRKEPEWDGSEPFLKAAAPLVHGDGDARLKERALAIRGRIPAPVLAALDQLDEKALEPHVPTIVPLLVHERRRDPSSPRAPGLRRLIEGYLQTSSVAQPGPRLPYGVVAGAPSGCGDSCEESDQSVAIDCGMGHVSPGARSFVKFLAR